ncbi:hypothetical protein MTO96_035297, partial [Rhipicephalus appendiculatus]
INTSADQTDIPSECPTTACVERMSDTAGYDESCADQWKSRLDMDKPCGMVRSKETCWLCDESHGMEPRDESARLGAGRVEARNVSSAVLVRHGGGQ